MNLDTCTPGQRHVVTTLDAPLVVAAGAGSGKTFTLTQRIAWSLLPGEDDAAPFANGVDEILAITYTNKAAAELKSRVKQQLLDEGLKEQALKVDDSWISTIHGMCSRLLREHALEFGIDPAFELVMGADADRLFDQALRSAYSDALEGSQGALARYLAGKPLRSSGPIGSSVEGDVKSVIDCVRSLPGGFSSFLSVGVSTSCRDLLRSLYELGQCFEAHAAVWKKPTKTDEKNKGALEKALVVLGEALEGRVPNFDDGDFDPAWFLDLVFVLPPTTEKYHKGKDDEDFFVDYRRRYAELGLVAQVSSARGECEALVSFAEKVDSAYSKLKGPSRLDNDDLISLAARQLELHPGLAQSCRDQFKLVMVDEFQDTNRVQVGLVRKIADPSCANVCMVGDAQQSIYKFRGADVSVFFDFQDEVRHLNKRAEVVELPDNFRSHSDVLAVVDKVFSHDSFFGERFLHLEPKGQVNNEHDALFDGRPRIEFFVAKAKKSVSAARLESAKAVAEHFADLRDSGADPGDMVLLLGAMSQASLYVEALRDRGFQSIITGGSVFADASEVKVVASLLRWWANPLDSEALLSLLAAEPFLLDEDTLLFLCREPASGAVRPLAQGFRLARSSSHEGLDAEQAYRLAHVCTVLWNSAECARSTSCSEALGLAFVDSGWASALESRGAEGLSCAGNVLKAKEIIRGIEGDLGVAEVSSAFDEHLVSSKEAPGSLTTASSSFVRIMTVHASKGLQFPHVALAELRLGNVRGFGGVQKLDDSFACVRKQSPASSEQKKTADKLYKWSKSDEDLTPPNADTLDGLFRIAEARYASEEREEAQRLLYVGMTRPVKSLFVSFAVKGSSSACPLYADVRDVFGWEEDPSRPVQTFEYGEGRLARLTYVEPEEKGDEGGESAFSALSDQGSYDAELGSVSDFEAGWQGAEDGLRSRFEWFDRPSQGKRVPGILHAKRIWSYSSLSGSDQDEWSLKELFESSSFGSTPEDVKLSSGSAASSAVAASAESNVRSVDSFDSQGPIRNGVGEQDDKSIDLGLAFHALAEKSIKGCQSGAGALISPPDPADVERMSSVFSLSEPQRERLRGALVRWFGSDVCLELSSKDHVKAEVPFVVSVPGKGEDPFVLEGEIDALAYDEGSEQSLLVDYKTGGSSSEDALALREKHFLQAACYAFALLSSGFESVEAVFVRVEQPSKERPSQPEVVRYSFASDDLDDLSGIIASRHRK